MKRAIDTDIEPIVTITEQAYPDCLIINHPDLKTMPLILGEGIITVLFWSAWFYLWLPLISILAWWLGFKLFYRHMVELGGFTGFLQDLTFFSSGVFLVTGVIAAWSYYNLKRFGSYNRRNKNRETDMDQLAASFFLSSQKLIEIQQAKHVIFSFSEDDSIKDIRLSSDRQL